jgi:hypothetical protein
MIYFFPESSSVSDTIKNKIYGVFSGIFGGSEERKLNDDEIMLRRMETHYKRIASKYKEIKNNIVNYLKSIKSNAEDYKSLSSSCFYMKDTLPDVREAQGNFKFFYKICEEISEANKNNFEEKAVNIEFEFEVKLFLKINNFFRVIFPFLPASVMLLTDTMNIIKFMNMFSRLLSTLRPIT